MEPVVTPPVEDIQPPVAPISDEEVKTGESTPPPPAPEETEEQKQSKKVLSGVQKRIDELTKQKYEQQREAQYWKQQAEEAKQLQEALYRKISEPSQNQYQDSESYAQAKGEWLAQQRASELFAEQQKRQAQEAQMREQFAAIEQQKAVISRAMDEGAKKYPDFVEAINTPGLPNLGQDNPAALQAIMESEYGIDVAYHLAKNPLEAIRIANLPPLKAVKEIARLETRFEGKKTSSAPPPVPSIGNNEKAQRSDDELSVDEWMARRDKSLKRKG